VKIKSLILHVIVLLFISFPSLAQHKFDPSVIAEHGLSDENRKIEFNLIAFSQRIARSFLAASYKALKEQSSIAETVYLLESTQESFNSLWPNSLKDKGDYKFLHNGL